MVKPVPTAADGRLSAFVPKASQDQYFTVRSPRHSCLGVLYRTESCTEPAECHVPARSRALQSRQKRLSRSGANRAWPVVFRIVLPR
jgi:hypothetical protein